MQTEFHRNVRVVAPVQLVWDEMHDLEAILAKSTQFLSYTIGADRETARFTANLAWGPLRYGVEGTAAVADPLPRQQTRFVVTVPNLGLRYTATIKLAPGGATETTLDYAGDLEVDHRMAGRMRGLFNELIEDHIHGFTSRVKTRAEQRRLADERLLQ